MFEYFEAEKAKKKALSTAEKKELKKTKDELEAPYTHCTLDGRKEKVGNFRIEPPGLFRGRGEHPKKGSLKVFPRLILMHRSSDISVPRNVSVLRMSRSTSVNTSLSPTPTHLELGNK
jgi:DNA topoisomerase-1